MSITRNQVPENYTPATDLLKDRMVLVTGAGDGIGRAAAIEFASRGATIVLLGKTIKKLEATYDEIENAGYPQAAIYPMNLEGATVNDYATLAETLDREFGRLDGILHNAAFLGELTSIGQYDPELWARVLQVNLNAPFLLTRACLDLMTRASDASLIFTSADTGRHGRAYWGAYGVSKSGIERLMEILADELETNTMVRVNSIDPGPVRTSLRKSAYPAEDPSIHPIPADIMLSYLYLMGPDSKSVTGQAFTVPQKLPE